MRCGMITSVLALWLAGPMLAASGELRLPVEAPDVEQNRWIRALNRSLADGLEISAPDGMLTFRFDLDALPKETDDLKRATRLFVAEAAPVATANQMRRFGLMMPHEAAAAGSLVVLVHGLDGQGMNWSPLAELLEADGHAVAYFNYPSDQPIEKSAALFAKHMSALTETFPELSVSVVAHSMGGVVARAYVEGPDYAGGVERLILLGTPNQGSRWVRYRLAGEVREHYRLWRDDPDWHPTWMITDGLGEAGRDLRPESEFLTELNARPRREGVAYTIVAGEQHPVWRVAADAVDVTHRWVPERAADWWGVRHGREVLSGGADRLRGRTGSSDGPVRTKKTHLDGVEDVVLVPADHYALYHPVNGTPPAAWETIRDRLGSLAH